MEAWDEKKWPEMETLFGKKIKENKRGNNMLVIRDSGLGTEYST